LFILPKPEFNYFNSSPLSPLPSPLHFFFF
jgi:hypothetical protein